MIGKLKFGIKFKIRQLVKMICQHIIFPVVYFFNRYKSIDKNLVILADSHHEKCPVHMEQMRRALYMNGLRIEEMFFDIYTMGSFEAMKHMIEFMKMYPQAGTVVICDYFLPVYSCKKKKKTKVIQLWHGCGAFKKFGYNSNEDIPQSYVGNIHNNYSLVTVSGEGAVKPFQTAMALFATDVVKPIGVSFTDRLYDADYIEECKTKFRFEHPNAVGKKVILWAPTFRGNAAKATGNINKIVGEEQIDILAQNEEYYIIKTLHPHMNKNAPMSTSELLVCADLLITDYSSVFFEFLLLDRPIIFYAPDYERYSKDRGFYLNYAELPGAVLVMETPLFKYVEEAFLEDVYKEARHMYIDLYMLGCDGLATKRIVDYILS